MHLIPQIVGNLYLTPDPVGPGISAVEDTIVVAAPTQEPREKAVIASLAILKVNSDHGADYIDNFVPFVADCLRTAASDVVSLTDLQGQLKAQHGLEVPQAALRSILDRAARAGYVERDRLMYRRNAKNLERLDFEDGRARALREVGALIQRLINYSGEILPKPWDETEAETALVYYLASRGTSLLAASAEGIPLSLPEQSIPNADYVMASFVERLRDADPDGFGYLLTAVKGSILASVLYFEDLGRVLQRFDDLALYFDTVVLVQALGFLGPEYEVAAREMMSLARSLGASLNCFQDTVKEIDGILGFAIGYLRSGRPSHVPIWGVTEFLVTAGKTATDIELISAHLVDSLTDLGINVRPRPIHVERLTIDEKAFGRSLKEAIRYRSDDPLQHDLDAITAIHRLRNGEAMPMIERSRAIFLTTNTALARAATRFFREVYGAASFAPLCMPAHQFGTLAWLKKPQASPDLPTKFIISDALAILNPSEALWREYIHEIAKLEAEGTISPDDCQLLRYSPSAKVALMGVTIGGSRAYLEGSVPEILARVRSAERRDAEAEAMRERALREAAEKRAVDELAATRADHARDIAGLRAVLATHQAEAAEERRRRFVRYRLIGHSFALAARGLLLIAFGALGLLGLFSATGVGPVDLARGLISNSFVAVVAFLFGAIGLALTVTGDGLIALIRPMERWIEAHATSALAAVFESQQSVPSVPARDDEPSSEPSAGDS